ncbi:hypothetical protein SNE40_008195 [Patella caerulea]|uniref:Protein quiver n=1 Tax=Patella caerulea TaxID=87958 RepID=A0AAN8QA45_PATCE
MSELTVYQLTLIPFILALFNFILPVKGEAIGCFACTSINHDNPDCEDKFNNTGGFYREDCLASRRGRLGLFPGTQCIKMIAEDEASGFSMIVRNCVSDNGGTNSETEIGRIGHCGWMRVIKYDGRRMRGCIVTCDTDGCNHAASDYSSASFTCLSLVALWTYKLIVLNE